MATLDAFTVAFVVGRSVGITGEHTLALTRGLVEHGVKVLVCCPTSTAQRFGFAEAGAEVEPIEFADAPAPTDLSVVARLRRVLRERRPDIVHAHGLRPGLAAELARRPGTPLVATWHHVSVGDGLLAQAERLGERRLARVAEVSLGACAAVVARVGSLGGRHVELCAVAAPRLAPPRRSPAQVRQELEAGDRPLVLAVAALHPRKGHATLIEAARRWRGLRPTPLVAIVGTGPAYRQLAAMILTGRAPALLLGQRDDLADLLGAADAAVISGRWEARPLFAQQAMAAGVPLVATAVGGLPDLVGDAALLVPYGDVAALDEGVRRLVDDTALRQRYRLAGLEQAAKWPTAADNLEQVIGVYRALLG